MKKVLTIIGVLVLILVAAVFISIKSAQNEPPPQLIANFTDLDKIERISKYRSCQGHVTVPQGSKETKRSMKHYFGVKPEYVGKGTVEIYSPYDGYVSVIRSEPELHLEGEIWIVPKRRLAILPPLELWQFSVQHIIVSENLKLGSVVKAGQLLGYAAAPTLERDTFDIVYAKLGVPPKKIDGWTAPFADLDSVFNHMSDDVFAEYQQKGVSVEELIVTKEERDQNPCQYIGEGPSFAPKVGLDDWAELQ